MRGSGRPLLLIGGLGAQLISWDETFCDLLVARGRSVIRFDNRDSGLSTILDDGGVPDLLALLLDGGRAPYALEDMAADAIGLLDHLGIERIDVVGLSLGGMIAQLMALQHPARTASVVAALSGPAGRPANVPSTAVVDALLQAPASTFEERVAGAVDLRRALAGYGIRFDAEEARARAVAQISRAHHPAGTMRQAAAVLATRNRLEDLRGLRVPTMVIHGELDPLIPFSSARAAADVIPDARFVGVPDVGHDLPPAVALELLERIVEFQDEVRSRPAR